MVPLNEEAKLFKRFKYANNKIGTRHKIGGNPDFIQHEEIPECKECNKPMLFYGQLDSLNDDFCIGDCGMIYVFICLDCLEVRSIIQSS